MRYEQLRFQSGWAVGHSLVIGVMMVGLLAPAAHADAPCAPLPVPPFSLDAASPSVSGPDFGGADVLVKNPADTDGTLSPEVSVSGGALGATDADDDIDALSPANAGHNDQDSFVILFSVDRATAGAGGPDPALAQRGVPYNVQDQATKGQQAGDQYMSGLLYSLGSLPRSAESLAVGNSQSTNNFDQGGTSFSVLPTTSSDDTTTDPQDNVDSTGGGGSGGARGVAGPLYYSLTRSSPSSSTIVGGVVPSGANVFHHPDPSDPSGVVTVFASFTDLGLSQSDDIDGIVVFDREQDGVFNGTDELLFTLTPDSPSLGTIPGASIDGAAADVFRVSAASGQPSVFATAAELGLGASADNVDALGFFLCTDAFECARLHGIRDVIGDFDDDGDVGSTDVPSFDACFSGSGVPYSTDSGDCYLADFDCDLDVDCADGAAFLAAWTDTAPKPSLDQCNVPAVSQWGLLMIALLILATGSVTVLRRSRARMAKS